MNGLIPPCCFRRVKYLFETEDPHPLSMKDVNLSYLLSLQLFSSLIFQVETFVTKGTLVSLC